MTEFKFHTNAEYADITVGSTQIESTSINIGHCNDGKTILLQLCSNGDIFVKGELCENNKEIVQAAYEFFCVQWPQNLKDIE